MSPSEIAFLALGIVLGAAIGAAIVEAVRSRPAPTPVPPSDRTSVGVGQSGVR